MGQPRLSGRNQHEPGHVISALLLRPADLISSLKTSLDNFSLPHAQRTRNCHSCTASTQWRRAAKQSRKPHSEGDAARCAPAAGGPQPGAGVSGARAAPTAPLLHHSADRHHVVNAEQTHRQTEGRRHADIRSSAKRGGGVEQPPRAQMPPVPSAHPSAACQHRPHASVAAMLPGAGLQCLTCNARHRGSRLARRAPAPRGRGAGKTNTKKSGVETTVSGLRFSLTSSVMVDRTIKTTHGAYQSHSSPKPAKL